MAKHLTHKSQPSGRAETLRRRDVRRAKYGA